MDTPEPLDSEMQRLQELCQEANARAVRAVELDQEAHARAKHASDASISALAEAQGQLKLWEDAAHARGLDLELGSGLPPWPYHMAEQYWPDSRVGPGTVKTQLEILEDRGPDDIDGAPYVQVSLNWQGESEQPDYWQITWSHYLGFLANELESYLYAYSPVPYEMMTTFLGSLTPQLRAPFEQKEGNYGQA
jgi:hypothetical protein